MEFAAALAEYKEDPPGWRSAVRPGTRLFRVGGLENGPVEAHWERVGGVAYPDFFEVEIQETEGTDRVWCTLGFAFANGEPELFGTLVLGAEATTGLDRVLSVKGGLQFWKRRALLILAAFGPASNGIADLELIDRLLTPDSADAARARLRLAIDRQSSSRRDRVTFETLEEASTVYRDAWRSGQNPTQAVAAHFHKSHSTAARWVGQARKLGLLGPADGSRGGEVVVEDDATALETVAMKVTEVVDE